jgi:hypothetical protein
MSKTAISSYEPPDRRTMKQRLQNLLDSQPNLMDEICQRVAGGESLQEIARNEMVPVGRFLLWIQSNPENLEQYKAACRMYADSLVHEGLRVGKDHLLRNDDGSLITDEDGKPFTKDVQWARLESGNCFKAAKMLDPDRFADRAPKIDATPVSSEGVAELARIVGNALEKRNRLPGAMDPTPQDAEILRDQ